ncbi:lipoyl(octanoyl) transferase LipB [Chloroflexota bacterium]
MSAMRGQANICWAHNLGLVDYGKSMQLQDRLLSARAAGRIPDTILLLQHPPVLTIGSSGGDENISCSHDILTEEGITIIHTDRGGNITYHGPGQLVGYLIFDLRNMGKDLHQYVHDLEEAIIRTLAEFSIPAHRESRYVGVWVQQKKVCSLGIRVRHWITKHGFALNINNDLKCFSYIHPCGIDDREVTSISQLLGHEITVEDVIECLIEHLSQVFHVSIQGNTKQEFTGEPCLLEDIRVG